MKSLAERHAQRNAQRQDAGLDPVDYGAQTGARSVPAAPSRTKKGAKSAEDAGTGEDSVAAGNGGGDPNWKPNA